jgi:hypothetical protein
LANYNKDGLDNPRFLEAFGNLGCYVHNIDLDEASIFYDLNAEEGQGLDNSSHHREPWKKKKKSNRPRQLELDNSHPDSDWNTFGKLQDAKAQLRRQKNFHPNRHKFSPTMVSIPEHQMTHWFMRLPLQLLLHENDPKRTEETVTVAKMCLQMDKMKTKVQEKGKKRKDHLEEEANDDKADDVEEPKDTPATAYVKETTSFLQLCFQPFWVKQAINGHLVRLTVKARDLRWRAPRHDTR